MFCRSVGLLCCLRDRVVSGAGERYAANYLTSLLDFSPRRQHKVRIAKLWTRVRDETALPSSRTPAASLGQHGVLQECHVYRSRA